MLFNFTHNGAPAGELQQHVAAKLAEHRALAGATEIDAELHATIEQAVGQIATSMQQRNPADQTFNIAVSGRAHEHGTNVTIYVTPHHANHDLPDRMGRPGGLKP